jgi:hypothetical protein
LELPDLRRSHSLDISDKTKKLLKPSSKGKFVKSKPIDKQAIKMNFNEFINGTSCESKHTINSGTTVTCGPLVKPFFKPIIPPLKLQKSP